MRARAARPEQLDLLPGQLLGREDPEAHRVVDVVVDVRDAVDEPHDLPLERLGLDVAGVREDPVAHLVREVEALRDPQRLLVVTEPAPEALVEGAVKRVLAGVTEGRMAHVVTEPDRLGEILVEPQGTGDTARDPGRLERVRHPRAVVVARRVDEDLRLPLEPPERLRVQDPVAVALERRAQAALVLLAHAAPRLVRPHGKRRERALLLLANAGFEGIRDPSGDFGHRRQGYLLTRTETGARSRRLSARCRRRRSRPIP